MKASNHVSNFMYTRRSFVVFLLSWFWIVVWYIFITFFALPIQLFQRHCKVLNERSTVFILHALIEKLVNIGSIDFIANCLWNLKRCHIHQIEFIHILHVLFSRSHFKLVSMRTTFRSIKELNCVYYLYKINVIFLNK